MTPMTQAPTVQRHLSKCTAPCWPVGCPDCPFGPMDMTLEEMQELYLGGIPDEEKLG